MRGAGQNQLAGEAERELYTQLMREHLRTMQGTTATTRTPQPGASHTARHFEHCATMPGLWQDPQVHLVSSAAGRSGNVHYDVVDFITKDAVEEEVVAGTQEGRQIIVKSGVKPKLETITLSQWSIANLAIMYRLLGEGKLGDEGVIDYLSYSTKIYQLTQRYENVSVYFYDREYRTLQASHNISWVMTSHICIQCSLPHGPPATTPAPHRIMSGPGSVLAQ